MKKFVLIIIVIYFTIYSQKIYSQYGIRSEDKISVEQQLKTIYGFDYTVTDMINVDSVENIHNFKFGLINDPYGTLKNCLLFTANKKNASSNSNNYSIVGIYNDNHIIWRSDFVIPEYFRYGKILGTIDLNNNGKVDFLTQWQDNLRRELDLWIYEWDGSSGTIINNYNESTTLIGTSEYALFDFADFEGDGIWEIAGYEPTSLDPTSNIPNDYEIYVYAWDGIKYNYSRTIEKNSLEMFFPHNKFTSQVIGKIQKMERGFFKYNYTLKNDPSSNQYINEFDIYGNVDTVYNITKPLEWKGYTLGSEISWRNDIDDFTSIFTFKDKIKPGTKSNDFAFEANGLPAIVKVYLRGFNYDLAQGEEEYDKVDDYLQNSVINTSIGPSNPPSPFVPLNFIDTLLNYNQRSLQLGWVKTQPTAEKYTNYFTTAKTQLQQNNIAAAKNTLRRVLNDVDIDSTANLTSEAYALLRYNTEYLLNNLPEVTTGFAVKLTNSTGNLLTGGSLKYYEGGWKDAVDNSDGTFSISTDKPTLSLRMNYEYGSQTVSNVPAQNNTYTFHTVNTTVQLKNSSGDLINEGTVKYYAGGWRDFGTIENGIASKELLPNNYSFRIIYAYSSKDKKQDISTDPNIVFQTVNAAVQLQNSQNQLIDEGTVKYYAGGWRDFGTTVNGTVSKELLANNYSFRMSYSYSSNDKQQDIGTNATIIFRTVNTSVQLQNSQGQLVDEGAVKYYAGGWRNLGTTINGIVSKELLPNIYSFRMTYAYSSNDKQQNIGTNPTVIFQTVKATVQLQNSQGQLIDKGMVKYYAGGWRDLGTTVKGIASKELLPNIYSFRMTYAYSSNDKQQNIGTNPNVIFQTTKTTVLLQNSQGQLIDEGTVKYYAGGWRDFGSTINGESSKELLPNNYSFRMTYEYISNDKQQDIYNNNTVEFSTILCRVKVNNAENQPVNKADVKYYAGGWRKFGITSNGETAKELFPSIITFRGSYNGASRDKQQNTGENPVVEIYLP